MSMSYYYAGTVPERLAPVFIRWFDAVIYPYCAASTSAIDKDWKVLVKENRASFKLEGKYMDCIYSIKRALRTYATAAELKALDQSRNVAIPARLQDGFYQWYCEQESCGFGEKARLVPMIVGSPLPVESEGEVLPASPLLVESPNLAVSETTFNEDESTTAASGSESRKRSIAAPKPQTKRTKMVKQEIMGTLGMDEGGCNAFQACISEFDDIFTDLLVDSFYLSFPTHKMMTDFDKRFSIFNNSDFTDQDRMDLADTLGRLIRSICNGDQTPEDVSGILAEYFFPSETHRAEPNDILEAAASLLKSCLKNGKHPSLKDEFKNHCRRYLYMYHHRAGFDIDRSFRYKAFSNKVEARLRASKPWTEGDEIKHLCGVLAELSREDEARLSDNRDFSIMVSSKKGCACLFTGPARFVNHDCNPNIKFCPTNEDEIIFKVLRNIEIGEELTCYYADNYFGEGNSECLCETCEKRGQGGFSPKLAGDGGATRRRRDAKLNYYDNSLYSGFEGGKVVKSTKPTCLVCDVVLDETTIP
ncbi:hypothetical protein HDU91_002033, partial [Kappamyces sp. JEL0680]